MRFSIFQSTRIGGRTMNQDRAAYSYSRESLLMVVADGMGGHLRGEVAADLAVRTMTAEFERQAGAKLPQPGKFLDSAMHSAQRAIVRFAQAHGLPEVPGTTCVACVVQDDTVWWGHVGDSRLYLFRLSGATVRTRDHSLVQQMIDLGFITEREAEGRPERNVITNCLGGIGFPHVELSDPARLEPGDTVLLCTDGLWGPLRDGEIAAAIRSQALQEALEQLMDRAESRTGAFSDNITALAMTWGGGEESEHDTAGIPVTVMLET